MFRHPRLAGAAVAAIVAFAAFSPAAADSDVGETNILSNPGFESDRAEWSSGTIVTSPVHSGTKALQINPTSQGARTSVQNVPVTGGAAYKAGGWINVSNLAGGARILIQWRNSASTILRTDILGLKVTGTADWIQRSGSLAAPSNATRARILLRIETEPDNAGQARYDDLYFGPASSGQPDLVVESPGTSPTALAEGQLAAFTAKVLNGGSSASINSVTRMRLDVNGDGTFDVVPGNQSTMALAGGSSETETWSNAWTVTAGAHILEVCADVGSAVAESNEANNCTTLTFITSALPSASPSPTPSPTEPPSESLCISGGVHVAAGANLTTVAAAHPAGTTFCLAEGTFVVKDKIVAQPGDRYIGAGRDKTFIRPSGVSQPMSGFVPQSWGYLGAPPITYRAMDIGGFTAALTNTVCKSTCGIAIQGTGDPLTGGVVLRDVRCHDNGTACVAAGSSVVAENIECDHNGFHPRSLQTDYRSAACIKMNEGSLTLRDSWLHDNTADAIWCDWCGNTVFLVENNVIEDNGRAAVIWEVSGHFVAGDHAVIRNNVIRNNGNRCDLTGFKAAAGVLISNAQNVLIEGNSFGANSSCGADGTLAVRIWELPDRKPPNANIAIRNNFLNGDLIRSCTSKGVTCTGNA